MLAKEAIRQVLQRLPGRLRAGLAARFPRLPVDSRGIYDVAFFERLFASNVDPWGFDSLSYETQRFARLLEVCGEGPFESALEIGCALGAFTERLAPRCKQLLAVDISSVAIRGANRRLADFDNVSLEVRMLPTEMPPGPFDLIVASDVMYYWPLADTVRALPRFEAALAPGGALVCFHYAPAIPRGGAQTGDDVHDALASGLTLRHVLDERPEFGEGRPYRIDRFEKQA